MHFSFWKKDKHQYEELATDNDLATIDIDLYTTDTHIDATDTDLDTTDTDLDRRSLFCISYVSSMFG